MLENLKIGLQGKDPPWGDRKTWGLLAYLPTSIKGVLGSLRYAGASLRSRRNAEAERRNPGLWRQRNPPNQWPVPKSGLIFWWRVVEGVYRLMKVRLGLLPPH